MVPTFDEYASTPGMVSLVPAFWMCESWKRAPPRISAGPTVMAESGVMTPSCSAAPSVNALWVEPGSATMLLATSSRSTGLASNGFAALYAG
jgi:hypothetical protein